MGCSHHNSSLQSLQSLQSLHPHPGSRLAGGQGCVCCQQGLDAGLQLEPLDDLIGLDKAVFKQVIA